MYTAFGLLKPSSDFTIDAAFQRLTAKFPDYSVTRSGQQVVVAQGDWSIQLALVEGAHLRGELEGLAGKLAGVEPAEAAAYVSTEQRVEVWSDIPDPMMEHFDDYLKMVEVLKSFTGLLAVDPREPGVL
jgi:hypothetical protein